MLSVAQVAVCSQVNTKHKYSVGRAYSCGMSNLLVHHVTSWIMRKSYRHESNTCIACSVGKMWSLLRV